MLGFPAARSKPELIAVDDIEDHDVIAATLPLVINTQKLTRHTGRGTPYILPGSSAFLNVIVRTFAKWIFPRITAGVIFPLVCAARFFLYDQEPA